MNDRHFLVYGLIDPETNALRYVGRSINGLARASAPHGAWCENWRQSLFARGLKPTVVIIEELPQDQQNEELLNEREIHWIAYHRSQGAPLTNVTEGGEGRSQPLSPEHRAKLRASNVGRPCTPETRAKISRAAKGKKRSAEQRARIAEAHRGLKASDETRAKMSQSQTGRVITEQHKENIAVARAEWTLEFQEEVYEKIAASKRGKPRDAATRAKLSSALKGKPWSAARRAAQSKSITIHEDVVLEPSAATS